MIRFLNDSAWLLLEKLKKHVILTKNHNTLVKITKISNKSKKYVKIQGFLGTPVETPVETPVNTPRAPR